jgi:hypothetical protein
MFGLFRKKTSPADFWEWLRANTARIQSGLRDRPEKVADEIGQAFKRSFPNLAWEVGPDESGPWTFCVSADGNRALFPEVIQAVRTAPEIPGWKVRAFRARGTDTSTLEVGGLKLGYEDVWCGVVERAEDGIRLVLCIRGLTKDTEQMLTHAAVLMLDNAVGEYDAVMKVKELGRDRLPDNPQPQENFFPLSELPGYLDRLGGGAPGAGPV